MGNELAGSRVGGRDWGIRIRDAEVESEGVRSGGWGAGCWEDSGCAGVGLRAIQRVIGLRLPAESFGLGFGV